MKSTYIYGLLVLAILTTSCEDFKTKMEEEQKAQLLLQTELSSLEEEEKLIKGEYADAMETLSSIDDALSEMAANNKEMDKLIRQKELAKGTSQEQLIMAKLQSLKNANIEADKKARRLHSKAKAFNVENVELKKLVTKMEQKFTEISAEVDEAKTIIGNMQQALDGLQAEVDSTDSKLGTAYANLKVQTSKLQRTNDELEATLAELKAKNEYIESDAKAFIACGSKKELRQSKILKLLSAQTLMPDFQVKVQELGTKINYYEDDLIDCGAGEIEVLLPPRDANSYKVAGSKITILDKKTFWATSKTVVLVKK